jgi:ATP-dependent RNA helicase DDX1
MAGGFDSLGLMPELLRAVDELNWFLPTNVQDEAIPLILGGGDVCAAAETGSGKTAAFCLPMLQCVHERLRELSEAGPKGKREKDNPDNAGGSDGPIRVLINENDKDNLMLLSADGCEATGQAEKQWTGARATHGVRSGSYYFEVKVLRCAALPECTACGYMHEIQRCMKCMICMTH